MSMSMPLSIPSTALLRSLADRLSAAAAIVRTVRMGGSIRSSAAAARLHAIERALARTASVARRGLPDPPGPFVSGLASSLLSLHDTVTGLARSGSRACDDEQALDELDGVGDELLSLVVELQTPTRRVVPAPVAS